MTARTPRRRSPESAVIALQRLMGDVGLTSPEPLIDGHIGVMTGSNIVAERILRLPVDDLRAEIATMVRTLWDLQGQAGQPLYPDAATRQRWAQITRAQRGDSSPSGGE